MIICGDVNCHASSCDLEREDHMGINLGDLLFKHNFVSANDWQSTYHTEDLNSTPNIVFYHGLLLDYKI